MIAYAIKLTTKWMVKKPGEDWEFRNSDWKPDDEKTWCKFILSPNRYNM